MANKIEKPEKKKTVATLTHEEASRKNIPTAEFQSVMRREEERPVRVAFPRGVAGLGEEKQQRNRDLDPQLLWRGKDEQDWSDLVTQAPPIYIQEKVHPKVLIDDLLRRSASDQKKAEDQFDLFADFNGVPEGNAKTEFYQHDANWTNRMILGDSLQVMASLAEREGLRGQVQCIYIDPPYGIKFNSNFQWSTTSRDVRDGNVEHITREPEQVKAFRDTWRDGIHSYLTYLRDRLTAARDLLAETGSIFVQIGDENVHRVRAVMDEVFGDKSLVSMIALAKTAAQTSEYLPSINDYILWYARDIERLKYRQLLRTKSFGTEGAERYSRAINAKGDIETLSKEVTLGLVPLSADLKAYSLSDLTSQRQGRETGPQSAMGFPFQFQGRTFEPSKTRGWSTTAQGLGRLVNASRVEIMGNSIAYRRMLEDFSAYPISNNWDNVAGVMSRSDPKVYVVQTSTSAVARCVLMATDPGDLVLDPTCGSGTSAYVAEQWGRRWITVDTSRVALALARARVMGARYSYYLLADSKDGQQKEATVTKSVPSTAPTHEDIRQGFVYERVPHVTLKSIANNAEIDVIWESFQEKLEDLRERFCAILNRKLAEWEFPREAHDSWPEQAKKLHAEWWQQRIARQREIDGSIAAKVDFEFLYDKPYEDKHRVRVAGPFTVESLSPHRVLAVDEDDELIDDTKQKGGDERDFVQMILVSCPSGS